MAKVGKTRAQLEAENRAIRKNKLYEAIASIVTSLIKWVGLAVICASPFYFHYKAVELLAGRTTEANISVSIMEAIWTDLKVGNLLEKKWVSCTVAILFGIAGVVYGWYQRKLRRDTVERLQKRNQELEKRIDPERSSSKLTPRGETRPGDEYGKL